MFNGEHTQKVKAQYFDPIPEEKRGKKLRGTFVVGPASIVLALAISKWFPNIHEHVPNALMVIGGYCLAGDIIRSIGPWAKAIAKDLAVAIREIKAAITNGK